ncbi:MAG: hypothetical protein BWY43_00170 [candidate division WS2 bacterium ADurb.Bin280]|uniref:Uncharacterized protein n=1 Tax=candidate division WS2 bacterium ADurb.Bin280 TaxID=1852829 RepID=A0A1V5SF25_9BACT|nr:MAG: hypothetical protein BWY43_00170 [candidate division WS2 bacterium ADurb.Bin280]
METSSSTGKMAVGFIGAMLMAFAFFCLSEGGEDPDIEVVWLVAGVLSLIGAGFAVVIMWRRVAK